MVSFSWSPAIPSGQRTYETPSCIIRKTIKSIYLEFTNAEMIDLFDKDNGFNEIDRLIFITGAIGVFCGVKNSLYAGYVASAGSNRISWHSTYNDCLLHIEWNSEGKKDITCGVKDLVGAISSLAYILRISGHKLDGPETKVSEEDYAFLWKEI